MLMSLEPEGSARLRALEAARRARRTELELDCVALEPPENDILAVIEGLLLADTEGELEFDVMLESPDEKLAVMEGLLLAETEDELEGDAEFVGDENKLEDSVTEVVDDSLTEGEKEDVTVNIGESDVKEDAE